MKNYTTDFEANMPDIMKNDEKVDTLKNLEQSPEPSNTESFGVEDSRDVNDPAQECKYCHDRFTEQLLAYTRLVSNTPTRLFSTAIGNGSNGYLSNCSGEKTYEHNIIKIPYFKILPNKVTRLNSAFSPFRKDAFDPDAHVQEQISNEIEMLEKFKSDTNLRVNYKLCTYGLTSKKKIIIYDFKTDIQNVESVRLLTEFIKDPNLFGYGKWFGLGRNSQTDKFNFIITKIRDIVDILNKVGILILNLNLNNFVVIKYTTGKLVKDRYDVKLFDYGNAISLDVADPNKISSINAFIDKYKTFLVSDFIHPDILHNYMISLYRDEDVIGADAPVYNSGPLVVTKYNNWALANIIETIAQKDEDKSIITNTEYSNMINEMRTERKSKTDASMMYAREVSDTCFDKIYISFMGTVSNVQDIDKLIKLILCFVDFTTFCANPLIFVIYRAVMNFAQLYYTIHRSQCVVKLGGGQLQNPMHKYVKKYMMEGGKLNTEKRIERFVRNTLNENPKLRARISKLNESNKISNNNNSFLIDDDKNQSQVIRGKVPKVMSAAKPRRSSTRKKTTTDASININKQVPKNTTVVKNVASAAKPKKK